MRSSSHTGDRQRPTDRAQTEHAQCDGGHRPGALYIVGIGPGAVEHLSGRAREVLERADTVVGYGTYVDLVRPLIQGREVISTGMTKEVERVSAALDAARAGKRVALVSSGDPGIYAMAGLALEMCAARDLAVSPAGGSTAGAIRSEGGFSIEVVPGIPALCAGAALLGAPLTHDFAAVSLSDLLTPWETIERRIEAAALADFVIVIYNPKSKKRHWQLQRAQELILKHRDGRTPAGAVSRAMRPDQRIHITTLDRLHEADVDMQTTVFVGNSTTVTFGDFMFTPRGYGQKYDMKNQRQGDTA